MSITHQFLKVFNVLGLLLLCSATGWACSCLESGPPCQEFWKANAVFVGHVASIRTESRGDFERKINVVRLYVSGPFRGVSTPEVDVYTEVSDGGSCGFEFQIGYEYLVYAYQSGPGERLTTGNCSRTRAIGNAKEDITYAKGLTTSSNSSTIMGGVYHRRENRDGRVVMVPMPNIRIVIEGRERQFEVLSDDKGNFKLGGLLPGKFTVSVKLTKGLIVEQGQVDVELAEKGCASVNFRAEPP